MHHIFGHRGRLLSLALWGVSASVAQAQEPQQPPPPTTPEQSAPEATPEATPEAAPEATPEAAPEAAPEATPEQAMNVAIYGAPPTQDFWEVQARVRASGPFMGLRTDVPFTVVTAAAEVALGSITVEGGYALQSGLHASAHRPFFNLGALGTFNDDYATGQGAWQGRAGATVGYDTVNVEYGEYGFERWHALSAAFALDATWWFSRVAGLELRLNVGVAIPLGFSGYDSPNVTTSHQITQGSPYPFGLLTLGLAFGRWSIF